MVAKLFDATIKHRLLWDLYSWKVYVRESLFHASQEFTSSFYTSLGNQTKNYDAAYTAQAYDGDRII